MAAKKTLRSRQLVEEAMREVHENEPSTVRRANASPERKEKMRRAIAIAKARKRGARYPTR